MRTGSLGATLSTEFLRPSRGAGGPGHRDTDTPFNTDTGEDTIKMQAEAIRNCFVYFDLKYVNL